MGYRRTQPIEIARRRRADRETGDEAKALKQALIDKGVVTAKEVDDRKPRRLGRQR